MAKAGKETEISGLARRFVADGLLDEKKAQRLYQDSREARKTFIEYVVDQKVLTSREIAYSASKDFGVSLLDADAFDVEQIPYQLISETLVAKHHALPLYQRGDRLYIGVSDPTNIAALNEFKFHTGLNTHAVLLEESKLKKVIEKALHEKESVAFEGLEDTDLDLLEVSTGEEEKDVVSEKDAAEDAPVVRFVHKLILDAINNKVSDIHFEPYEHIYRIRYRRDGVLYEAAIPPISLASRITARLKVMSDLDISERRVPQDGHFKLKISKNRAVDFRISTLPTTGGEKVVIRVLDPSVSKMGVEALGFNQAQKDQFLGAVKKPQGMVLVTGPTGSGKTVTLYTALNILNNDETNISTVEDPVEINLQGVNQVNVNTKAGLHFSNALRAFLRQDPDVIMVGEIRDLETAEIAIKAAQTGHMVLSTLHTNSAPETLTRLSSMGVPHYNIGSTVSLVIAQRLARCLCGTCKVALDLPKAALNEAGIDLSNHPDAVIYGANLDGCEHCKQGYSGRIGLYEVMPVTSAIEKVIFAAGTSRDILEVAKKEGMWTLRDAGVDKVLQGITSIDEINRVTVN